MESRVASYCTIVGPQSEALSTSFGKWHLLLLQRLLRNNMRLNDLLPRPAVDDGRMGERSRCRKPGARFLDCRVVKPLIPRSTTVAAPKPVGGAWSAAGFPAQAHPEGYTRLPVRSTRRLWEVESGLRQAAVWGAMLDWGRMQVSDVNASGGSVPERASRIVSVLLCLGGGEGPTVDLCQPACRSNQCSACVR